jgi:hypothetical protein
MQKAKVLCIVVSFANCTKANQAGGICFSVRSACRHRAEHGVTFLFPTSSSPLAFNFIMRKKALKIRVDSKHKFPAQPAPTPGQDFPPCLLCLSAHKANGKCHYKRKFFGHTQAFFRKSEGRSSQLQDEAQKSSSRNVCK